jgi:hypothetical protein
MNADPAAMDFTAKGAAVDQAAAPGAPPDPVRGMEAVRGGQIEGAKDGGSEQPASEEEQAEYERCVKQLETIMYSDKVSRALVDQIQPQDKIGSVVKACLLFLKQFDAQVDMDEMVVMEILKDIVDRVIDMAERVKGIEFSEKELQAVLGSVTEGAMQMYGVDPEGYQQLTKGMDEKDIDHHAAQYKQFLGD